MVLGTISRARSLAGNPAVSNVSDADVSQGLAYGTSQVIRLTGKDDFETDVNHRDYATAATAAEYFASSMIRDRFDDQTDISSEHFNRGNALAQQIADSLASTSGAGGGSGIAVRQYRSNPLNSAATTYRSMLSQGQILVGTENLGTQ